MSTEGSKVLELHCCALVGGYTAFVKVAIDGANPHVVMHRLLRLEFPFFSSNAVLRRLPAPTVRRLGAVHTEPVMKFSPTSESRVNIQQE